MIVTIRARKLHMPIAVAAKNVGNSSVLMIYRRLKPEETPILATPTNIGIKEG